MGGAAGHLSHLFDNRDLTFAEIKEILEAASEGRLERVSEKLDGMNLVFTWQVIAKKLVVARNSGDIMRGGMDANSLAKKFAGRGNVESAFNGAFKVLNDAVSVLDDETAMEVFGPEGDVWYSIEVIYAENPNVINYDSNSVVFHQSPIFEIGDDGRPKPVASHVGVDILAKNIDSMQKAIGLRDWRVRGPALVNLKKISDGTVLSGAISSLNSALNATGLSDANTIGDYLHVLMKSEIEHLSLSDDAKDAVIARTLDEEGAPTLTAIKKMVGKDLVPEVSAIVKNSQKLQKKFILPIEKTIQKFATELLRGLGSTLIDNSDEEVMRLRDQTDRAIKAIESSGNEEAMTVLNAQLEKLESVNDISAAMEGIVFFYKGSAYKFTGAFAAMNQILGLFKYGRGSIAPIGEDLVRQLILDVLNEEMSPSASMDAEELNAKAAYEKALYDLNKWDVEDKKRSALYNRANELGIKIGDNKAFRDLKSSPEYAYDINVLKPKRETLQQKFDKVRDAYGLYNPAVISYRRATKTPPQTDVQRPDKSTRAIVPIRSIKPLQWYSWNDHRWVERVSDISYGVKDKTGNEQAGVGPGEARLAEIFGGKVQGGNVSFDVVTPDGQRWEVKALNNQSEHIRPGIMGKAVFDKARKRLDSIIKQMHNFAIVAKKIGDDNDAINYIHSFVEEEADMISKGEISPERFKAFRTTLNVAAMIKKQWSSGEEANVDTTIRLANKKVTVDKPTYIDVAKRVQKAVPNVDILGSIKEHEIALSALRDSAFDSPAEFIDNWYQSIDINNVFEHDDGVFIVNTEGFNLVPRSMFKKAFVFRRVSQGFPRFEFAYFSGTPQSGD